MKVVMGINIKKAGIFIKPKLRGRLDFKLVNKRLFQLISVLKYFKNHLIWIREVMEGD